jgi:tRNA modification GTPase
LFEAFLARHQEVDLSLMQRVGENLGVTLGAAKEAATTTQAAKSAMASLQGVFSSEIHLLVEKLTHLRMYVEAAIDFPEEEIDFLSDQHVKTMLADLKNNFEVLIQNAHQGALLKEGVTVVIAGKPNAGKSSLLNCLSGRDAAIVTAIPGTTRDVLREHIDLDGLPLHIVDTAGLRDSDDVVEQEGIKRAWQEIARADIVLFLVDGASVQENNPEKTWPEFFAKLPLDAKRLVVRNKIDLTGELPGFYDQSLHLSLTQPLGIDDLKKCLKELAGFTTEGKFMARRRHLDALHKAYNFVKIGGEQLAKHKAGELLAEDLRQAQLVLGEITGEFSSDDLLGKIFSSFCIGK